MPLLNVPLAEKNKKGAAHLLNVTVNLQTEKLTYHCAF